MIGDGGEGEREDGSVEAGDDAGDDGEEGPRVGENIGIVYEREDEEPTDVRWAGRGQKSSQSVIVEQFATATAAQGWGHSMKRECSDVLGDARMPRGKAEMESARPL